MKISCVLDAGTLHIEQDVWFRGDLKVLPLNADLSVESFESTESNRRSDFIAKQFSRETPLSEDSQPSLPLRLYHLCS